MVQNRVQELATDFMIMIGSTKSLAMMLGTHGYSIECRTS
jgi:hypothetical protein